MLRFEISDRGLVETDETSEVRTTSIQDTVTAISQSFRSQGNQLNGVIASIKSNQSSVPSCAVTITVRQGDNTSGAILHQECAEINPIGGSTIDSINHTFASPVSIVNGALYTIEFTIVTGNFIFQKSNDTYTDGTLYTYFTPPYAAQAGSVQSSFIVVQSAIQDVKRPLVASIEGTLKLDSELKGVDYRDKLNGKIRVYKDSDPDGYNNLLDLLNINSCKSIDLRVFCDNTLEYTGIVRRGNIRVNKTKCYVSIDASTEDQYSGIERLKETERSIYNAGNPTPAIPPTDATTYESEAVTCYVLESDYNANNGSPDYAVNATVVTNTLPSESERTWLPSGILQNATEPYLSAANPRTPSDWCVRDYTSQIVEGYDISNPSDIYIKLTTTWHRELIDVPTGNTPLGANWIFINTSGGRDFYYRCPLNLCSSDQEYSYGRRLSAIAESFASDFGLTAQSILLNIGSPTYAEPINKEYAAKDSYQYVTLHAKSDIVSPNASTPAFGEAWRMTFEEFAKILKEVYQVEYKVVGDNLIFEHLSFFESELGEAVNIETEIIYSIEDIDTPYAESFSWGDKGASDYFNGSDIVYGRCGGEGTENHSPGNISTDLCFIRGNEDVSKSGFVLIANELVGSELHIIDNNTPHSYTELHTNFWRYDRYLPSGEMNGEETSFDSPKRLIKIPYKDIVCCGDVFDKDTIKRTCVGNGKVQKASLDLDSRIVSVDLLI